MSDVLKLKQSTTDWAVHVGGVCVGGYDNEISANCVYRAIKLALAKARSDAIDECIAACNGDAEEPLRWARQQMEALKGRAND